MKLVRELDKEENIFIVSEEFIKKGIYFDIIQEDLLCNSETIYDDYIKQRDTDGGIEYFEYYLKSKDIPYLSLQTETCISLETLNKNIEEYKYHYCSETDTYTNSEIIIEEYVIESYFEFWNGVYWIQKYLSPDVEDVECINKNLELYKGADGSLYKQYKSSTHWELKETKVITEEEIMTKYGYKIV